MRSLLCLALCCLLSLATSADEPFRILAWNIESGGSDPDVIERQLREMHAAESLGVLALSEVPYGQTSRFANFFRNHRFDITSFVGTTGGDDRLLIEWEQNLSAGLQTFELCRYHATDFAPDGHCAPIGVKLYIRSSRQTFLLVNNNLARRDALLRAMQARLLVEWARRQEFPVILVGSYNFDYDIATGKGNEAFDAILRDGIFKWVKPTELVDTNWADSDRDGADDYPNSMLDFVFVSGEARDWKVTAKVIVREGDFPDDDKTSDHRPVLVTIE